MDKSIFSNIKFGDKFITKDGRMAIYWDTICYPEEYYCREFIIDGECIEVDIYTGITLNAGNEASSETDIVGKWMGDSRINNIVEQYIKEANITEYKYKRLVYNAIKFAYSITT